MSAAPDEIQYLIDLTVFLPRLILKFSNAAMIMKEQLVHAATTVSY
jgi:hypothetical protein